MSGKRQSPEAKVLAYFRDETLDKAELVFGLVKDIVSQRKEGKAGSQGNAGAGAGKKASAAPRKKKKAKGSAASAGTGTGTGSGSAPNTDAA